MAEFIQINSSTFKTESEQVRQTIVGNSKSALFEPCVEIIPWEEEHGDCLKIWKDIGASQSIETSFVDKERLIWRDADEEWMFSPFGVDTPVGIKDPQPSWSGAQFVITLTKKPKIDLDGFARFVFRMSGYENLRFLHQPKFTQAEVDFGGYQPDWAIDSLAIYHKSKLWSCSGKSFKTGKVLHAPKCWCLDNLGHFTTGKWEYDLIAGTLTKCIPENAFNYPGATAWHVDATFGNTAQGGASQSLENLIIGTRDGKTPAVTGTGNHMTAWLDCSTAIHKTKCNVYLTSDDSQVANAQTDEVSVAVGADNEQDFNFSVAPTFTNGVNYDLWSWCESTSGDCKLYLDLAADEAQYDSLTYGAWPGTIVPDDTWARIASIYVDYTAGVGGRTTKNTGSWGQGSNSQGIGAHKGNVKSYIFPTP